MTRIKLCGLSRPCDIHAANDLKADYIGFVFAPNSKRYVTSDKAAALKKISLPQIQAVGVFVNEKLETVAELLNQGIIDLAQLHGNEDEEYIKDLQKLTGKPVIKAFRVKSAEDIRQAQNSVAEYVLLDAGAGTGTVFDWELVQNINRPYFLAGGLSCANVKNAITTLRPFAVDVSSGIETNGAKDKRKMAEFVAAVRKED
ncbi:MAG: phosphoribosylanthranilate isomerase [Lachnospiraceae bacterium]